MDQNGSYLIKKDQNYIEITIVNSIIKLESDSYQNQRSNPNGLESESSMIQFGSPNCLSLVLSIDPASAVIRLELWPHWHPQLLMLHYEYSEYASFNTRLLQVTHGITIRCPLDHSLHFEFLNALELFRTQWDLKSDQAD